MPRSLRRDRLRDKEVIIARCRRRSDALALARGGRHYLVYRSSRCIYDGCDLVPSTVIDGHTTIDSVHPRLDPLEARSRLPPLDFE